MANSKQNVSSAVIQDDAVPVGVETAEGAAVAVAYANFGQRLLAWLIDGAALFVIRMGLLVVFGVVAVAIEEAGWETERVKLLGGYVVLGTLYVCGWLYYAIFESSRLMATPGKLALGLRVIDVECGPPTFLQASFRFFFRLLSALWALAGVLPMRWARNRGSYGEFHCTWRGNPVLTCDLNVGHSSKAPTNAGRTPNAVAPQSGT